MIEDKENFVLDKPWHPENNTLSIVYKDNDGKCCIICAAGAVQGNVLESLNQAGLNMIEVLLKNGVK